MKPEPRIGKAFGLLWFGVVAVLCIVASTLILSLWYGWAAAHHAGPWSLVAWTWGIVALLPWVAAYVFGFRVGVWLEQKLENL